MTRIWRLGEHHLPPDELARVFVVTQVAVDMHDLAMRDAEEKIDAANRLRDEAVAAYAESERWADLAVQSAGAYAAIKTAREIAAKETVRRERVGDEPIASWPLDE